MTSAPAPAPAPVPAPALASLFRRRADELERGERSPLCVALMRGAGASAAAGGAVAELFAADPLRCRPGSVPELRLLGALHHLVLSGHAAALARHYPSAGGGEPPAGAWIAAEAALAEHPQRVRDRIARTVQTNEPGRCTALFGGLLWLADRHRLPIRLLEIGASAGLHLNADRYGYVVAGRPLGDPACELQFVEPWRGAPVADLDAAQARLEVVERAGCDPAPIDSATEDGRRTLQSYIWPDELERLAGVLLASRVAAREPPAVDRSDASAWLRRRLADGGERGVLTVVWQSVMRQYLDDDEWTAICDAVQTTGAAGRPIAWLTLEPPREGGGGAGFELRCRELPREDARLLAICGYHGPPVRWQPAG